MAETFTGTVDVQDTGATVVRITLNGDTGGLVAGGNGQEGLSSSATAPAMNASG